MLPLLSAPSNLTTTLRGGVSRGHCRDSREERALSGASRQGEAQVSSSMVGTPATSAAGSVQGPKHCLLPGPPLRGSRFSCTVRPKGKEISQDPQSTETIYWTDSKKEPFAQNQRRWPAADSTLRRNHEGIMAGQSLSWLRSACKEQMPPSPMWMAKARFSSCVTHLMYRI